MISCVHRSGVRNVEAERESRSVHDNMEWQLNPVLFTKALQSSIKRTISRWLKRAMQAAGVDTSIFTAHSVRSASTSKAALSQVSIKTILATAGWSRATTFSRYYERPIVDAHTFSDAIMGVNNSAQ